MSAFVLKIRDTFSDFWLELELFFGKMFHRSKPLVEGRTAEKVAPKAEVKVETKVETKEKEPAKLSFSLRMLRMSNKERLFFFDQLSTLVTAGVPLIESLSLVQAQTKAKSLKKLYGEMIHHVNAGMTLANAMALFPSIFPAMQVALIEAGEKSGNLKIVLAEVVEEMEADQDFMSKITGAMFYPAILIFLALTMVTGMLTFVIPKVSAIYEQSHVSLPRLTQTVINISTYVKGHWQVLLLGVVGGLFLLWLLFSKVMAGRMVWEKIVGILPIVGKLSREKNLMIIASNMAMLMKSGVLIGEAFEITEKTVGNLHYKRALADIRHGVIMGREVSEMMGLIDIKAQKFQENPLFPLQMAQLIHIGETTGTIAEMMAKIKKNYHKSIDYTLRNLSTMVEPIMIFFVAALVGSILLAVMLPFFYIGTTIH